MANRNFCSRTSQGRRTVRLPSLSSLMRPMLVELPSPGIHSNPRQPVFDVFQSKLVVQSEERARHQAKGAPLVRQCPRLHIPAQHNHAHKVVLYWVQIHCMHWVLHTAGKHVPDENSDRAFTLLLVAVNCWIPLMWTEHSNSVAEKPAAARTAATAGEVSAHYSQTIVQSR